MEHLFVFGFIILLTITLESTNPKDGTKRY